MNKEILLLSWHPEETPVQTAGGFKRAYEIVARTPKHVRITCLDKRHSFFEGLKKGNIDIDTYTIPKIITKITKLSFIIGKSIEKIYVSALIFLRIVTKYRKHIIYVPYSELMQLTFPAILAKLILRNRVVFCNLNVNHFFPENLLNPLLHKFTDLNITLSYDLQDDLRKKRIKCEVLNPVGVDFEYAESIPSQQKNYDAIYIGRHTKEKGVFDALEVCSVMKKTHPEFKLVTIGNLPKNDEKEFWNKVDELGIKDNVIVKGIVSEFEKFELIKQSRVCVFPSHQEGWGIVPQEAIISDVPVVAYDLKVYEEHIKNCEAVRLVSENDVEDLSKKVEKLLSIDNSELEAQIKQSKNFLRKFSWEGVAEKEFDYILNY